jgi:hypothetical protein
VLSGIHSFYFEPSKTTPGGTTFKHTEIPQRLNLVLMKLLPITEMFDEFSRALKARVEAVQGTGRSVTAASST